MDKIREFFTITYPEEESVKNYLFFKQFYEESAIYFIISSDGNGEETKLRNKIFQEFSNNIFSFSNIITTWEQLAADVVNNLKKIEKELSVQWTKYKISFSLILIKNETVYYITSGKIRLMFINTVGNFVELGDDWDSEPVYLNPDKIEMENYENALNGVLILFSDELKDWIRVATTRGILLKNDKADIRSELMTYLDYSTQNIEHAEFIYLRLRSPGLQQFLPEKMNEKEEIKKSNFPLKIVFPITVFSALIIIAAVWMFSMNKSDNSTDKPELEIFQEKDTLNVNVNGRIKEDNLTENALKENSNISEQKEYNIVNENSVFQVVSNRKFEDSFSSSPITDSKGYVYIGNKDGYFYKLDNNLKTLWKQDLKSGIAAEALLKSGFIFISTYSGNVFKLDSATGEILKQNNLSSNRIIAKFANYEDDFYIGDNSNRIFMLNKDLKRKRYAKIQGGIWREMKVDKLFLYIPTNLGYFYKLDRKSFKKIWKIKLDGNIRSELILNSNNIYTATDAGSLYKISEMGDILVKINFNGTIQSGPILFDKTIYFGVKTKGFYAYDLDLKEIWKYETNENILATPAVQNKISVFAAWSNNAYVINNENGELIQKIVLDKNEKTYSTPLIFGKNIYIAGQTGKIYRIESK